MSEFGKPHYGTSPEKIHRTDAPDTSIAAAYAVDTRTDEERVHNFIKRAPNGLTVKDLEHLMGKSKNTFSGRITRLLKGGLVKDSGERRDGCRVIVNAEEE